jgi:outer membrane lipoprotein-sorting protein
VNEPYIFYYSMSHFIRLKNLVIMLSVLAVSAMSPLSVQAADKPAATPSSTENAEDLSRLETYLNGLTTVAADFSQIAPDGALTGGKFYLKRPGKLRWQYDPPTPILMVASDDQFVYYDYELEQLSYIPFDNSLASFLAQKTIDLNDRFIRIDELEKTPGMVRLTLSQTDKPEAGKLTLEFSDEPLLVRNMVVTDSQGQVTTVALNNAQFGLKLDDKLFRFVDPRKNKRR